MRRSLFPVETCQTLIESHSVLGTTPKSLLLLSRYFMGMSLTRLNRKNYAHTETKHHTYNVDRRKSFYKQRMVGTMCTKP